MNLYFMFLCDIISYGKSDVYDKQEHQNITRAFRSVKLDCVPACESTYSSLDQYN